jgi:hypothetical protein
VLSRDPDLDVGVPSCPTVAESHPECIRQASTDAEIPQGTSVPTNFTGSESLANIHRQWSQEAATAAARLIASWAFDALDLQRSEAQVDPQNRASQHVLRVPGSSRRDDYVTSS